ncbi:hypothetical protein MNBD_NITROSPINAE02-624 [hydrothermal vent metagenome]|uniref:Cytochrome c domain-containing protein n=1 Tax=hydrothermal vent metagenome TaxID=652676 RepID=A0A3B1BPR8_9ZZZZ
MEIDILRRLSDIKNKPALVAFVLIILYISPASLMENCFFSQDRFDGEGIHGIVLDIISGPKESHAQAPRRKSGRELMNEWLSGETLPVNFKNQRPPEDKIAIEAGRGIYIYRCAVCHGIKGDGKGERAKELQTRPRDFTFGIFKFRSTPTGAPPTDEDIFKTISRGIHGTGMLPWFALTTTQRWLVTYYIKTFSDYYTFYYEDGQKPVVVKTPEPSMSEKKYIELGKTVYIKGECAKCHGKEGYGDGDSAGKLKDDWYQPIRPTNFRKSVPKRGLEPADIYMTIATGLNGTPMPSYSASLTHDEMLGLAYYIRSIAPRNENKGEIDINQDTQAAFQIDHMMGISFQIPERFAYPW